jgi:hypothetical protein
MNSINCCIGRNRRRRNAPDEINVLRTMRKNEQGSAQCADPGYPQDLGDPGAERGAHGGKSVHNPVGNPVGELSHCDLFT